ncbi:MAG TPA: toprim domain-containing protein [Candidatus Paceibacterota bacterium]|nr:toprim domain-containing protein [Candidatus Paceibacterota bacterium]
MNTAEKLAEIFKMFPGIGERQAKRFVHFLMSRNPHFINELSDLLLDLQKGTRQCKECFRFYTLQPGGKNDVCDICSDSHIDSTTLLVIERDSDLESIKKSGTYEGKYFVLGGLVPIVEKNTQKFVRIKELKERLQKGGVKEVILAFTLSPQGDHTDHYLRSELGDLKSDLKISSLGRGLSTGTELEYSDNDTIRNALKNRQ